jgi:hypothetical protein
LWADGRLPVLEPGTRNYSLESFPTGRDHAAGALRWCETLAILSALPTRQAG